MTDRPILFSAPMVRALLDGRKTQTRRVISRKPSQRRPNLFDGTWSVSYVLDPGNQSWREAAYPWRVGDRLWVREAWNTAAHLDRFKPSVLPVDSPIFREGEEAPVWAGKLRPSMFMPRWASRITLIVTDVRVQRVQEISEADAIAEGFAGEPGELWPIDWYRDLWEDLNAARGYGWESNPWVVALTFRVIKANIDSLQEAA